MKISASDEAWLLFTEGKAFKWLRSSATPVALAHLYNFIGDAFNCRDYSHEGPSRDLHSDICIEVIQKAYDKWKLEQEDTPNDAS